MKKTSVQKAVPVTLLPGVGMLFIVVLLLLAASGTSLGQAGGTLPVTVVYLFSGRDVGNFASRPLER